MTHVWRLRGSWVGAQFVGAALGLGCDGLAGKAVGDLGTCALLFRQDVGKRSGDINADPFRIIGQQFGGGA